MGMMSFAQAETTLTVMAPIEAAHHDPARTSAGSPMMYLVGDTLVSLDYDLRTVKPLLAKSWTISEDGKTYTFKLRDDVTFCSGKKFIAERCGVLVQAACSTRKSSRRSTGAWARSRTSARPIPTPWSTS